MYCPAGNVTGVIWRVLASSLGISSWTPLKPQHSNPNPNPLANQLRSIDSSHTSHHPSQTPYLFGSLMPLNNWCSIHARWSKSSLKYSICFCVSLSKFKTEFYCIWTWNHKIGQSSQNMYSNNILKFQESTTILNTYTKKSGNLLNAPRIYTRWTKELRTIKNISFVLFPLSSSRKNFLWKKIRKFLKKS